VTLAYKLADAGVGTVLLQDKGLAEGATQDTTAFLMQDVDTELADLARMFGEGAAGLVWRSHREAIDEIQRIAETENIACDFMRVPAFIYANDEKELEYLEEEERTARKLGFKMKLVRGNALPFRSFGHLELPDQGKFHPLKFLFGTAAAAAKKGARIFEKSEVKDITGQGPFRVATAKGAVLARRVVIATYYPFKNPKATLLKKGMYRSYVFEVKIPRGMISEALYLDMANPYDYFRIDRETGEAAADRMILGGQDHRAEIKMSEAKNFRALEEYLRKILPDVKYEITRKWSGPILEPSDGLALIGETKPGRYVATAFSGNGMTYSLISAMLLTDLLTGRKNKWRELYDPNRPMKAKPLLQKGMDYTEELVSGAVRNIFKKK
jgi:glycine/D-amino acid oxidase-like deaminating enzyme